MSEILLEELTVVVSHRLEDRMKEDLLNLLELQHFDKIAYDLRKANTDLPIKIAALQKEISEAKNTLDSTNHKIEDVLQKIKDNQDFVQTEKSTLDGSGERLNKISTNKEYDAIHSEIATHKKNIEEAAANALHFQQVLENLKTDLKEAESVYEGIKNTNGPVLEELTKDLNSLEGRIAEETKKSQIPREKIAKKVISVYDRVVKRRQTPYVISTINWTNNVCSICKCTQPPQKLNFLSKMTDIQSCETCGSILIWKEADVLESPAQ